MNKSLQLGVINFIIATGLGVLGAFVGYKIPRECKNKAILSLIGFSLGTRIGSAVVQAAFPGLVREALSEVCERKKLPWF